jgi:nitrogen-specific signal transduction histidine kinase
MGFGWKLTISFFLLFLIGALCGVALTFTFAVSHSGITRAHAPRQWEDDAVRNLTNRLGLNPAQQTQARASLHDVITRIRTIQRDQQIENITLFDKALETLYPMLTTEQQHKLDVFRQRRKESLLKRFGSPTP